MNGSLCALAKHQIRLELLGKRGRGEVGARAWLGPRGGLQDLKRGGSGGGRGLVVEVYEGLGFFLEG